MYEHPLPIPRPRSGNREFSPPIQIILFWCAAFREHKRLTGRPHLFCTGRGARTVGLVDDRTRTGQLTDPNSNFFSHFRNIVSLTL